jgi:hypothetical protein
VKLYEHDCVGRLSAAEADVAAATIPPTIAATAATRDCFVIVCLLIIKFKFYYTAKVAFAVANV